MASFPLIINIDGINPGPDSATTPVGWSGPPGGLDGDIQFNNNGAFGGYGVGTGLAVVNGDLTATGGGGGGLALGSVADMASLVAFDPVASGAEDGAEIYMSGYYSAADGGEGLFIYVAASSATANAGTIVAPASGVGRWFRLLTNGGNRGIFNVRWYGAKGTGVAGDATTNFNAIEAAILDAKTWKPASTVISKVYFPAGTYYTNGHTLSYGDAEIFGDGSGMTRVRHADGIATPIFYFSGGINQTAAPYGGIHHISPLRGTSTMPAEVYWDPCIDNQVNMDDLGVGGLGTVTAGTAICDGLSIFDFLNFGMQKFRNDGIGGYGLMIRGDLQGRAGSGAASASGPGAYKVGNGAVDTTTGRFVLQTIGAVPLNGTGVMIFTSGTLPTPASGAALVNAGGEIYFAGVGSTEVGPILYRTRPDALAGTNPITYSVSNTGNLSLCMFNCTVAVTAVTAATDRITYNSDKHVLIPTSTAETGRTNSYGAGYTGAFNSGGAGALGGLKTVFVHSDGTYPTGIVCGTPYYPIYIDAFNIKLATTIANAVAGTAIDLVDTGSGNISLMYDSNLSHLGTGGFSVEGWTYDNASSPTLETINGVACGGLGLMYSDHSQFPFKGPISVKGHRIEVNKMTARDQVLGNGKWVMIRCETGIGNRTNSSNGGPETIQLTIEDMVFESSVSIRGEMIRIIGNRGNTDIAPNIISCQNFGFGQGYNNDNGTAFSMTPQTGNQARSLLSNVLGDQTQTATSGLLSGLSYSAYLGRQTGPYSASQPNGLTKTGDLPISIDRSVYAYKNVNTTVGFTKGTGAQSAGTVTGTVAAGSVFTLSAATTAGVGIGTAVSIPGAGAAAAALTGVISYFDNLSATKTFVVSDSTTGLPLPCLTDVTGVTMTFLPAVLAQVPAMHSVSASLAFGTVNAGLAPVLTIAAPTNVTFTAGKPVYLGFTSQPVGIIFNAFVTAGGATISVVAFNPTAGNIAVSTQTFTALVAV